MEIKFMCKYHQQELIGDVTVKQILTPISSDPAIDSVSYELSTENMRCPTFVEWRETEVEDMIDSAESAAELDELADAISTEESACRRSWSMGIQGKFDHLFVMDNQVEVWT